MIIMIIILTTDTDTNDNSPSTCVALRSSSVAMPVVTLNSLALKEVTLSRARALSTPRLQQLGPGGHTARRGSEHSSLGGLQGAIWAITIIMIEGQLKDRERRSSEFMTLMDGACLWRGVVTDTGDGEFDRELRTLSASPRSQS